MLLKIFNGFNLQILEEEKFLSILSENNCFAFKSIFDKINEIKNEKSILIVLLLS